MGKSGPKFVLHDPDELMRLLQTRTQTEVGAIYGVTKQAISHYLRFRGYETPRKNGKMWRPGNAQMFRDMAAKGKTGPQIARAIGVNRTTIWEYARKTGTRLRHGGLLVDRPGCPECETVPYARGLCRNCYAYVQRRRAGESMQHGMMSLGDIEGSKDVRTFGSDD